MNNESNESGCIKYSLFYKCNRNKLFNILMSSTFVSAVPLHTWPGFNHRTRRAARWCKRLQSLRQQRQGQHCDITHTDWIISTICTTPVHFINHHDHFINNACWHKPHVYEETEYLMTVLNYIFII